MQYRLRWWAFSNVNFRGATDWEVWDGDGDPEEVLSAPEMPNESLNMPAGLEEVLQASGFEWDIETREEPM